MIQNSRNGLEIYYYSNYYLFSKTKYFCRMIENKIDLLVALGKKLQSEDNTSFTEIKLKAERLNRWFTQEFIDFSINSIADNFLNKSKLNKWLANYDLSSVNKNQTIGIILAGNLPLVGFQDILTCFVLGVNVQLKLSSKDETLTKFIVKELKEIDSSWQCDIVDRLINFDKVIATGSNNTNRYFEYYFRKVPNLLRNNRNSVAILNGNESDEELESMADDIFMFFGQGCRNISRLFVPKNYEIIKLFPYFKKYEHLHHQKLYMDNYDYTRTLLLMNQTPHYANEFIMLKEETMLQSRLATLNYSFYTKEEEVVEFLKENENDIQCVVSQNNTNWKSFDFGQAQKPELWDYADNVDVVDFLLA